MCCDFIPFSTVFHETGQKYLLPDMTKCSWHNMRYCSGLPSVRFRSGFLPCNCTATRTFSVHNNWFPMSCLFDRSVPVAAHTGQNLPNCVQIRIFFGEGYQRTFIYQLSQSRMTFFCFWHSSITWRILSAASLSFEFYFVHIR